MNEKIDESWADFWKNRVLMQYECPALLINIEQK